MRHVFCLVAMLVSTMAFVQRAIATVGFVPLSTNAQVDSSDPSIARFQVRFRVDAIGQDVYLKDQTVPNGPILNGGVFFSVMRNGTISTGTLAHALVPLTLPSTTNGFYEIEEGNGDSFSLEVAFRAPTTGLYRMELNKINWNEASNPLSPLHSEILSGGDWATPYVFLNAAVPEPTTMGFLAGGVICLVRRFRLE